MLCGDAGQGLLQFLQGVVHGNRCSCRKHSRLTIAPAPALALTRTEASLLFGRGMRAGIDRREQKKQARVCVCVCMWCLCL